MTDALARNERVRIELSNINCDRPAVKLQVCPTSSDCASEEELAILNVIDAYDDVPSVLDHCPLDDLRIVATIATLVERKMVVVRG